MGRAARLGASHPTELKHSSDALESDAAEGHLFLVRMGGDGGGPIDLYVDEAIPGEMWFLKRNARYHRLNKLVPEFRLANESPLLVFELRSISDRGRLNGGSVSL